MKYKCLDGLQPKEFFYWFGVISAIPRPSRKEDKMISFLKAFADERGIAYEIDAAGNVFMTVPASDGYDTQPSVLLQAHMDIVPNKDEGKVFDFETESLQLYVDGDKLTADGTTLGADNGVGIATMLAIAASKDIAHPTLELLFTVSEEVGLVGIRSFDMSKIKSRRMLNMDCGETHMVCVCSAGKISSKISKDFELVSVPSDYATMTVLVSDITGGHAATVAKQGRGCAPSFLAAMLKDIPMMLTHFEALGDTVFRKATATFSIPAGQKESARNHIAAVFAQLKEKYKLTDPDAKYNVCESEAAVSALSEKDSSDILQSLYAHRTQGRCPDAEGRITASSVIMEAKCKDGHFDFTSLIRALNDKDSQAIFDELAETMPIKMQETDRYSGWPERTNSPFRRLFNNYHKDFYGEDLAISRALGGLEVGPILGAIADMDAVGYAPSSFGAHTTSEYLAISEAAPYWKVLKAVLAHKE